MSEVDRFKRNVRRLRGARGPMAPAGAARPEGTPGQGATGQGMPAQGMNPAALGAPTQGAPMQGANPAASLGILAQGAPGQGINPAAALGAPTQGAPMQGGGANPAASLGMLAQGATTNPAALGALGQGMPMQVGGMNPAALGAPGQGMSANPAAALGAPMESPPDGVAPLPARLPMRSVVGETELIEAGVLLSKYRAGKAKLEHRVIACEQWWKLRQWDYLDGHGNPLDERPASAWLFNCIISKHADAIEAYPEPNIRPREAGDREEARKLTSIVPVVLEQNEFDETYSRQVWQKLKQGTGIYGVFWDKDKLNGLGDIAISKIDVLSIYWEPGIEDIQKSRNVFTTELVDIDLLREAYPEALAGRSVTGQSFQPPKYLYDDTVDTSGKAVVVDWYYRKLTGGRRVLHYVKYVDDVVLYATENDPELAERGLYDHGMYPFIFDPLFPIEGSPCGYGYIDIGKGPQADIDRLNQAILKNALMTSTPRFFVRGNSGINEKEFLDWTKPLVKVEGGQLGENDLREIRLTSLNALTVQIMQEKVNELKETTGNRDANTGGSAPGVTAASAIIAMQEQAGKTSKAATLSAYRAFGRMIDMVIELIRQFYDQPRAFRILGESGGEEYVAFTNEGIAPQPQEIEGADMGPRLPAFDVDVSAQRMSAYTKVSQNELALQLFRMGVLDPQNSDKSLALLDIMDFGHKDLIEDKVRKNGTMYGLLAKYQQMALALAMQSGNAQAAEMIARNIQSVQQGLSGAPAQPGSARAILPTDPVKGTAGAEGRTAQKARARAQQAAQPRM